MNAEGRNDQDDHERHDHFPHRDEERLLGHRARRRPSPAASPRRARVATGELPVWTISESATHQSTHACSRGRCRSRWLGIPNSRYSREAGASPRGKQRSPRYCNWMSNENVQAVREVIDGFNRRDLDAAMAPLRDDVMWGRFLSRAEATSPAVQGKAELLGVWKSQVEAVDIRVEPEEFIPVGNKVIAPMRMCARGSGSAIELVSVVTWVSTFDDGGLCTKVEAYESRDEALRGCRHTNQRLGGGTSCSRPACSPGCGGADAEEDVERWAYYELIRQSSRSPVGFARSRSAVLHGTSPIPQARRRRARALGPSRGRASSPCRREHGTGSAPSSLSPRRSARSSCRAR